MFGKIYLAAIAAGFGLLYSLTVLVSVVPGGVKSVGLYTNHDTGKTRVMYALDRYGNESRPEAKQFAEMLYSTNVFS